MNGMDLTPKSLITKQQVIERLMKGTLLSDVVFNFGIGTNICSFIDELKSDGHKIKEYFVESTSGSRYKKYWIEKDYK